MSAGLRIALYFWGAVALAGLLANEGMFAE